MTALPDPANVLAAYLREAVTQARLGYEYAPNSYSYAAFQACLGAEQALDALRAALAAEYDAAQERGEVAGDGRPKTVPADNGLIPALIDAPARNARV